MNLIVIEIFLVILFFLLAISFFFFILPLIEIGAPFEGTRRKKLSIIFNLSHAKKTDKVADLGSGDGRIIIEFAKRGIESHGYEINPLLVWISRRKIKQLNLQHKAFVHYKSFWKTNLSNYSIITMFQYRTFMPAIERKLQKELKPSTKIISNHWKFKNLKLIKHIKDVYLYKLNKN
jgi:hypothetical protein